MRLEALEARRVLATFVVDSVVDRIPGPADFCAPDNPGANNNCTLRLAIQQAENTPGPDTIELPPGNYNVNPALDGFALAAAQDTAFIGNPADPASVVIDGVGQQRLFDLDGAGAPHNITFQGLTIQNGIALDGRGGGAIIASNDVDLVLDNVIVQNNTAERGFANNDTSGGGVQASENLTIDNSVFRGNVATADGGGIDFSPQAGNNRTLQITDTTFTNNSAGNRQAGIGSGGGLIAQNAEATVILNNATFDTNIAGDSGGGAFVLFGNLTSNNSVFLNNSAQGPDSGGGGLYVVGEGPPGAIFEVNGGRFEGNNAVAGAGGFESVDAPGTIDGTEFQQNQVIGQGVNFDAGGGAIVVISLEPNDSPLVEIRNALINNNSAPNAGGIAAIEPNLTITDTVISNNNALGGPAGGIGVASTNVLNGITFQRVDIVGNTATGDAGGVGALDSNLTLIDSNVDGNQAVGGRGGGIGLVGQNQVPALTTDRVTASNNIADGDGGGIAIINGSLQFLNTTISDNTSNNALSAGGGIFADLAGNGLIEFSTIASNNAGGVGDNLNQQGAGVLSLRSVLLADGDGVAAGLVSLGNNLDQGGTLGLAGAGDLNNIDPQIGPLQDNGGLVLTRALALGSPAIDAGSAPFPAVDARSIARALDGNGDTVDTADIGAFEAPAIAPLESDLVITNDASDDPIGPGETLVYTIVVTNNGPNDATGVQVDDALPTSLTFVTGDVDGNVSAVAEAGGDVVANIGNLAAGASATVTIETTVGNDAVATIDNTAIVSADQIDPDQANNDATVSSAMSLSLMDDVLNIDEDETDPVLLRADVLANDLPGGARTIVFVSDGNLGEASIIENGTAISYDPDLNEFGQDVITYRVDYNTGQSATADLTVNIAPVNDEPTTTNDNFQLPNNRNLVINIADLLGNDSSGPANEGQVLIFNGADANSVNGGSIVATVNTLTYEPAAGFNEPNDSFDYRVSDGAIEVSGTVNIAFPDPVDLTTTIVDDIDPVEPGDDVTFTVDIINQGNALATSVLSTTVVPAEFVIVSAVSDALGVATIAGNTITSNIAALDPGVTSTVTIVATAGNNAGNFTTDATVESAEQELTPADNVSDEGTTIVAVDLTTTISDDVDPVEPGDDVTFTVEIINQGNALATSVLSTTVVPAEFVIVSAVSDALGVATIAGNTITSNIAALDPGVTSTVTIVATAGNNAGNFTTDTTVESAEQELTPADNVSDEGTTIVAVDLTTTISDDVDPVEPGDDVTFTVEIINQGNALATSVLSTTVVPAEFVIVSAVSDALGVATIAGNTITSNIAALDPGVTSTVTIVATAGNNAGNFTTDATVESAEQELTPADNLSDEGTTIVAVDLTTTISDDVDPVEPGDDVTFTVDIINQGNARASSVLSTTVVPAEFVIVSAVSDALGVATIAGNTITSNIAALDPGVTSTVTIVATAGNNAGNFTTDTTVESAEQELTPADNLADEDTSIEQPPTVTGHVYCDANGNGAEDPSEAVIGTTVFLDEDADRTLDGNEQSTVTNNNGDYEFFGAVDPASTVVVQIPAGCNSVPRSPTILRSAIDVGILARSLAITDLDGNGTQEILVVSEGSNTLTVLNNNQGELVLGQELIISDRPRHITTYHSAGSSTPIVSIASLGTTEVGGAVSVMEGLANPQQFTVGNGPIETVIADFDGNNQPDVLAVSYRSSDLHISLNGGDFTTLSTARAIRTVDAGDVNGDGNTDIVLAGFGFADDEFAELFTMMGDGRGGFSDPIRSEMGPNLVSVKVVDLTDSPSTANPAILTLSLTGDLSVLTANGSVTRINSMDVGEGSSAFDVGDFNRDGLTDLAIANLGDQQINLYVGDGTGDFSLVTEITNVSAPSALAVDDVDGDLVDDIVVANLYHDLNLGGPGPRQYRLPSRVTLLRLNQAEGALVASGDMLTAPDFEFQSADPSLRLDVTGEGEITTLDALAVINRLSVNSPVSASSPTPVGGGEGEQVSVLESTDVNGDGVTSALDALLIVNHLASTREQILARAIDLIAADDDEDHILALDVVLTHSLN